MITVDFRSTGPLFTSEGPKIVQKYTERAVADVAIDARSRTVATMMASFRHPTPVYWTTVHATKHAPTLWKVTDTGLPYGHWLEGTGSRNFPVTRFRGYRSFGRTRGVMRALARDIALRALPPWLRRLGGA